MIRRRRLVSLALLLTSGAGMLACAHVSADAGAAARQAVIEANMPELQSCWDDLAADYPGVSGSLLFNVELRRNGTVDWVDIAVDELGIPKLGACTVRSIKKWRFPDDRKPRSIRFGVGFTG